MNPELRNTHKNMRELGLAALSHANWHANYISFENGMWSELSVLQAAHAAEILIKSRIAQEHPLLIFEQLPRHTQILEESLSFEHLANKSKTIQYSDLPDRLWATTGIKIKNLKLYKDFGNLRNCIQHFADPRGHNCSLETIQFIYEVIDPFINECWGLYAIDYNEDNEPYVYLIENLIRNSIDFLVPPKVLGECIDRIDFCFGEDKKYMKRVASAFAAAGYNLEID